MPQFLPRPLWFAEKFSFDKHRHRFDAFSVPISFFEDGRKYQNYICAGKMLIASIICPKYNYVPHILCWSCVCPLLSRVFCMLHMLTTPNHKIWYIAHFCSKCKYTYEEVILVLNLNIAIIRIQERVLCWNSSQKLIQMLCFWQICLLQYYCDESKRIKN